VRRCVLGLLFIGNLSGCVSSAPLYTAAGQKGHVINCTPGWNHGIVGAIANANTAWGDCLKQAGEICGARGYDVLERVGEEGASAVANRYGGSATTTNNRTMVIQCKGE
jgi:hypothetical protein